jgi:hypothetical protein
LHKYANVNIASPQTSPIKGEGENGSPCLNDIPDAAPEIPGPGLFIKEQQKQKWERG